MRRVHGGRPKPIPHQLFFAVIASVVVALLAIKLIDVLAGLFGSDAGVGLIFPPSSSATYHTTEFDYTARVNSLGFRDREFTEIKPGRCRVVAIGDSFTFGWGVPVEASWPKVLDARLDEAGLSVEVANLGSPGGSPADYAAIAARAIPLLKPDLVIVGVLQGDDLESAGGAARIGVVSVGRLRATLEWTARALFPHLMARLQSRNRGTVGLTGSSIDAAWQEQVRQILAGLSPTEKAKYAEIDSAIRSAFESGNLNPPIIWSVLRRPDYFINTFELDQPQTRQLIQQLAGHLARIRDHAAAAKAEVMAVSVPFGLYNSREQFEVRGKRLGFFLDPRMLSSSAPDEAIRLAADRASVPFSTFTSAFRAKDGESSLFFPFDGHLNDLGHRLFAEQLTSMVAAKLQSLPAGCRK